MAAHGRARSPAPGAMLREARVGHLATADAHGQPHVIPVCFVFDGRAIYTAVDEKPKRVAPKDLRRVRNILMNPRVALVVDHYEEDWRRLRFALVTGTAELIEDGPQRARAARRLREKYPQYRAMALEDRPVLKITPRRVVSWASAPPRPRRRTTRGDRSRRR